MGLVNITLGMAKGPKGTSEIYISIKQILSIGYLVPKTVGRDNNHRFLNYRTDFERFTRIY